MEYLDNEEIRKHELSLDDFVHFLNSGSFYVILSHPAQGNHYVNANWDLEKLGEILQKG